MDKLPKIDSHYINWLSQNQTTEITADIIIFGYQKALSENRYLAKEYPFLTDKFWQIGTSGQGDDWFIDLITNHILFYDHNQGEFESIINFLDMGVNFETFIKIAFILKGLENLLDTNNTVLKNKFKMQIENIDKDFLAKFPYQYY